MGRLWVGKKRLIEKIVLNGSNNTYMVRKINKLIAQRKERVEERKKERMDMCFGAPNQLNRTDMTCPKVEVSRKNLTNNNNWKFIIQNDRWIIISAGNWTLLLLTKENENALIQRIMTRWKTTCSRLALCQ